MSNGRRKPRGEEMQRMEEGEEGEQGNAEPAIFTRVGVGCVCDCVFNVGQHLAATSTSPS